MRSSGSGRVGRSKASEWSTNLLVTDEISSGTGGVPVLDAQRRMVAMTFAEGEGERSSIPIEDLFNQFPDAF